MNISFARGCVPVLAAVLAGCASVPPDWGRGDVAALAAGRGLQVPEAPDPRSDTLVNAILAHPLAVEDAVRVALLRNPALRALYARLGLAAADVYEAGRLSNPTLSAASLDSNVAGALNQVSFGLVQSFTDLLLLKPRGRIARGRFEAAKAETAGHIFELSVDVERAFYVLAAAQQQQEMRGQIEAAAAMSADLAERYHRAGNINRMDLALEQAAASDARLQTLAAQGDTAAARNALQRLLGLDRSADWDIVSGLAAPPESEPALEALYTLADDSRLDLAAARGEATAAADRAGLSRDWHWLGVLEVGAERERESDGERLTGPTLAWELPLFDPHGDDVTRAQARLMEAQARLQALTLDIANEVELGYARVRQARARIRELRDSLIPLREEIVKRGQEQVNYMLLGAFDLLRFKAQEYDAYAAYLGAVGDYWAARTDLKRAAGAPLPGAGGGSAIDAAALLREPAPAMHHEMQHDDTPAGHDEHGDKP